ncbi:hypothetical protein [Labedaea rhizosphaerae]|uniref:Uncharacterized protein n=1 Tax=Labedaea rhizosphaerae TaxID=598644 RepID=A0A4R6SBK4_LABRH|nr:hypothetical protein [Labedaea rhizosphaerae]TDP96255.1 hypothetical protein EV186_104239 [Labedaea rhizosphaerae]
MEQSQIEQGLRDVLLAEPPLGIDPDRVADAAARSRRNRRAGFATGIGFVAVAAVAAGATIFANAGQVQPAAPPKPGKQQEIDREMARNAAYLRFVLPKMLPQARDLEVRYEQATPPGEHGAIMTAHITFTDSAGPAEIQLFIESPGGTRTTTASMRKNCVDVRKQVSTEGRPLRCTVTTRPDHTVLGINEMGLVDIKLPDDQPVQVNEVDMTHLRPGVGAIAIDNVRYPIDENTLRERYPLTEQQEIALVTDPALVMHDPKG